MIGFLKHFLQNFHFFAAISKLSKMDDKTSNLLIYFKSYCYIRETIKMQVFVMASKHSFLEHHHTEVCFF